MKHAAFWRAARSSWRNSASNEPSESTRMNLCVAQTRPVKGDITANIERHKRMIALAGDVDVILFPELSLTGYEPSLAKELAIDADDRRLDTFQTISDSAAVTLGIGAPTRSVSGRRITMFLFQPHRPRLLYSKRYLHRDEEPFFSAGQESIDLKMGRTVIAPAICYELSVPEHSANAVQRGASIYMASVAKTAQGLATAIPSLAEIARTHSMTVLMANSVGECDGCECGGKTSIWNHKAMLLGQLNHHDEGILIVDMDTEEIVARAV
jgi:predicted amidohydrolase